MYLKASKAIVRLASLYNAGALVFFLIPGGLALFGISEPYSSFWRVLPALLASYGAIVLWLSSYDVLQYGSFVFWNGMIRVVFAAVALIATTRPRWESSFCCLLSVTYSSASCVCS